MQQNIQKRKGTGMFKDGEDLPGFQTTKLTNMG